MRTFNLLLAFLALTCVAAAKGVVDAGSDFNSKVIGSGKNAFVKFLAPW